MNSSMPTTTTKKLTGFRLQRVRILRRQRVSFNGAGHPSDDLRGVVGVGVLTLRDLAARVLGIRHHAAPGVGVRVLGAPGIHTEKG